MARNDALLRIHKKLLARRTELCRRLGMALDDLAEHTSSGGDTADAAFDAASEALASSLAELEARELLQVERALAKLKNGTYGRCEGCGCKIPIARLNALPYCTHCIKCQRELEEEGEDKGQPRYDWSRVHDPHNGEDIQVNLSELDT
jgi:DnaK suppressor protein